MSEREKQHPAGEPGKEAKESKDTEEKKAEQAAGEEKEQELVRSRRKSGRGWGSRDDALVCGPQSEEDRALKEKLDGAVEAFLSAHSASERSEQLGLMSSEIKNATTTMTSVPKPLKFLRPHYGKLAEAFEVCIAVLMRGLGLRAVADVRLGCPFFLPVVAGARSGGAGRLCGHACGAEHGVRCGGGKPVPQVEDAGPCGPYWGVGPRVCSPSVRRCGPGAWCGVWG